MGATLQTTEINLKTRKQSLKKLFVLVSPGIWTSTSTLYYQAIAVANDHANFLDRYFYGERYDRDFATDKFSRSPNNFHGWLDVFAMPMSTNNLNSKGIRTFENAYKQKYEEVITKQINKYGGVKITFGISV